MAEFFESGLQSQQRITELWYHKLHEHCRKTKDFKHFYFPIDF